MALLKVLLLLGLGVSVNSDVSLQKRIIGGHNCAITERLYHVRVEMTNGTHRSLCGGSLIHTKWVLTTENCWKSEAGWTNKAKFKVHPRTLRMRTSNILGNIVVYDLTGWRHDITLLKLQRPITDVPLALLPDCSKRPTIGATVQLAGEGATTTGPNNERLPNPEISARLQCVNMKVVQASHFLPAYGHVFTAAAPNTDVCHGDVGSAVVFNGMIYGVITPVPPEHAFQMPVYIADVCEYIEWIRTTIGAK